ncbi:MAG: PAS domain S-box protein [Telluria sp.]
MHSQTATTEPTDEPTGELAPAQRIELLVSGIRDYAIYMLDPRGYISSWNTGAQRFKGYTEQEVLGLHFSQFYTPEDRAAGMPERALRLALEDGKFESEGWRVRKDGSRFWASIVIDPVYDQQGHLAGFAKITRDITEKKQMQQELLASEQRFRLLVQGVTDYAIYMLSPAGKVTNWNAGAERIKGYAAAEVIGNYFGMFYTPEEQAAGLPQRVLVTAERENKYEAEGWRVRKDGSRFWAHVVVDAIRDETGTLLGFAKITRDITEKRRAAEELEQAREALFQSQKLEAIGQLTGGVAHDFNNLLAVLSSGLDVLASLRAGGDRRVLDSMRRAIDRGATLTQQLLSFARQQPLNPACHDVNKLIRAFEALLRRATTKDIVLSFELAPTLPLVLVDEARFEAALLNLIVNARDALPEGGRIAVSTEAVTLGEREVNALPAGAYVRVCVRDNGCGMAAATVQRAFEPFFTTKPTGKGTGLGLSQVQGFIAQSGGDVTIESRLGEGTAVMLYLPASGAAPGAEVAPEERKASERVLIVEDEADLMNVAAELFKNMGYEVLSASNGEDALAVLERNPDIEVLFSDVVMPGMSGIELARAVRSRYPAMRIVLASGYPLPTLRAQQSDTEEFTYVGKPYRLSEILKRLR